MMQRPPTLTERLWPHRRKRIATALYDDALTDDVLTALNVSGTFTPDEWADVLSDLALDARHIGDVLDSRMLR